MRLPVLLSIVVLFALPTRAVAAPIGTFDWVHDVLFGTGSSFIVTNESATPFESVFVDLYAPGAPDPFRSLMLGDVDVAGGFAQTIDDLSLLLVPDDLTRAVLRLTYGDLGVTATLLAVSLQGDPSDLLTGSMVIDDGVVEPPVAAVPEPSTSLLLLVGAGAFAAAQRRAARRRPAVRLPRA